MRIDGYTLTYLGLVQRSGPNSTPTLGPAGRLDRGGPALGTLSPGSASYPIEDRVTNEVDIRTSLTRGTDLYSILQGVHGRQLGHDQGAGQPDGRA